MSKRVFSIASIIALTLSFAAAPSQAHGQSDIRVATRAGVQVRSTPSPDGIVVETLSSLGKVTVLETLGSWLRVATSTRVGYVKASDFNGGTVTPVMSVMEAPTPLYRTESGQTLAGYKDPGTATLFSVLLTGGGQFYSGESKKGAALLGIGLGGLIVGAASSGVSCDGYSCSTSSTPLVLGALAYVGTWIYGIMDAGNSARRHNAAVGLKTVGAALRVKSLAAGSTGIGFSVSSPSFER